MSKKGKNKQKAKIKKRYRFSKNKFISYFCSRCQLCPIGTNATFCFGVVYEDNPVVFVNDCFPKLCRLTDWPTIHDGRKVSEFKKLFCETNICKRTESVCENYMMCVSSFEEQMEDDYEDDYSPAFVTKEKHKNQKKKKGKKRKGKKKSPAPTPVFFTNGDDKWVDRMKRALYGDNYKEQDTPEGHPAKPEGVVSKPASVAQS